NAVEKDLDLIELALSRILRDNPRGSGAVSKLAQDEGDRQLLLRLLDQLNSLRTEREQKALLPIMECSRNSDSVGSNEKIKKMEEHIGVIVTEKDLIREIRFVKKQNMVTHAALGIMLMSSTMWRSSQLFVALRIRNKINHPLKTIGDIISGRGSRLFAWRLRHSPE
ncbi:hypothetical protein SUGI_0911810, partial [Cryptomeria japonica]